VDFHRVEAQAMERRRLSYEERTDSDEMRSACRLVAKVMAELPETGAREATTQAMILRHKAPSGDPDGERGHGCRNAMTVTP